MEADFKKENSHLEKTLLLVNARWEEATQSMTERALALEAAREEMLERVTYDMGGLYSKQGFEEMTELSQAMQPLQEAAAAHQADERVIKTLLLMRDSPYFARIDFCFEGEKQAERVYIGRSTLMDKASLDIAVYDWRTPIASVYYRHGVGDAEYEAPNGIIRGKLQLKRQYEIRRGELKFYFDADVQVQDAFLRELLSKNTSLQMKSIVETIQRDQDQVIRDMQSELMMVQGAAGSGKTSVALHRIAYLMYQGLVERKLESSQILIISPNAVFEKYISRVLPELGERQVKTVLFDEVFHEILPDCNFESRSDWVEKWLLPGADKALIHRVRAFKGSAGYTEMMERFIKALPESILPICDVFYGGTLLYTKEELREKLLKSKKNSPLAYRLKWLENEIMEKAHALKPARMAVLRDEAMAELQDYTDIKATIRMLLIKDAEETIRTVQTFTKINCEKEYRALYENRALFMSLSQGLLPQGELEEIRQYTLAEPWAYEDAAALCYLTERVQGYGYFTDMRQVVLDEAQDTDEMHMAIMKLLFPRARFTVLGDVHQTLLGDQTKDVYESFRRILNKEPSLLVNLNKSFRCTRQIWAFAAQFLPDGAKGECFSRDGEAPQLCAFTEDEKTAAIAANYLEAGLGTVALITKTRRQAQEVYERLKDMIPLQLLDGEHLQEVKGAVVLPVYVAKGLEFDSVIVVDADETCYVTKEDRDLLYIATTRALHRLCLVSKTDITPLVEVKA